MPAPDSPGAARLDRQRRWAPAGARLEAREILETGRDHGVKAQIVRKAFHGSEFLHTLQLPGGKQLPAHHPSHHSHSPGEWPALRTAANP
jgi:hypothetical protein